MKSVALAPDRVQFLNKGADYPIIPSQSYIREIHFARRGSM
jgi:hypothetical protein